MRRSRGSEILRGNEVAFTTVSYSDATPVDVSPPYWYMDSPISGSPLIINGDGSITYNYSFPPGDNIADHLGDDEQDFNFCDTKKYPELLKYKKV